MKRSKPPQLAADWLIASDEVGGLGDRSKGNCYIMVASKVKDRDKFAHSTKRYGLRREIKFSNPDDVEKRMEILDDLKDSVEEVRYVCSFKPTYEGWKTSRKTVHETLLRELRSDIGFDDQDRYLVMVDENQIIADELVRNIIKGKRNENPNIDCVVLPSVHFYELQSHDMIAGAINMEINRFDSRYVEKLGVPVRGRLVHIR